MKDYLKKGTDLEKQICLFSVHPPELEKQIFLSDSGKVSQGEFPKLEGNRSKQDHCNTQKCEIFREAFQEFSLESMKECIKVDRILYSSKIISLDKRSHFQIRFVNAFRLRRKSASFLFFDRCFCDCSHRSLWRPILPCKNLTGFVQRMECLVIKVSVWNLNQMNACMNCWLPPKYFPKWEVTTHFLCIEILQKTFRLGYLLQ